MTIEEFEEYAKSHDYVIFTKQQYEHVIDVFNNYELLTLDYYGRLKVDMLAMLTEIQLELEELEPEYDCNSYSCGIADCYRTIQEKINALRGEQDPTPQI